MAREPNGARALVVDDDALIRKVLAEMCRSVGLEVDVAADGSEAMAKLRAEGSHVMLLDVEMPHMNGFDVLEQLQAEPVDPAPAVIMVTSRQDAVAKIRSADLGAIDHIEKPFRLADVQRRLQRALKVHDLERRLAEEEESYWRARSTDQDTGVGSFAQLSAVLDGEFRWASARKTALTCVVIADERYGAAANTAERDEDADRLRAVSELVAQMIGTAGRLFRVDAAELVVLLPATDEAGAQDVVKRIVSGLQAHAALEVAEFAVAAATVPHAELLQPTQLYRAANVTLAQARASKGEGRIRYFAGFAAEGTREPGFDGS